MLLSCFKKNFSQNMHYYQVLLKNKGYCGEWQNLTYFHTPTTVSPAGTSSSTDAWAPMYRQQLNGKYNKIQVTAVYFLLQTIDLYIL